MTNAINDNVGRLLAEGEDQEVHETESYGWAQIIFSLRQEWALMMAPQEVLVRAIEALGSEESAVAWLTAEQFSLGDEIPLDFCSSPQGRQDVQDVLGRIEHGICL